MYYVSTTAEKLLPWPGGHAAQRNYNVPALSVRVMPIKCQTKSQLLWRVHTLCGDPAMF